MKKLFLFVATAALTLASCTNEDITSVNDINTPAVDDVVSFEPYMARNTRATTLTDMTSLKAGFGVFAYDQGVEGVETYVRSNISPNFMFNTKVAWNSTASAWEYTPVKYWPNNPGNKVSFFAYAPYVDDIKKLTGSPRLILERENMGPAIYYNAMVADLDNCIDLCWGSNATQDIADPALNTEIAPVDYIKNPATGQPQNVSVSSKIKFNFKHALSRLKFNVQIFNDIITDGEHHGTPADGGSIDVNSQIDIKSLKLIGYLANEGTLSLYDGKWDAQYESRDIELLPYISKTNFKAGEAATEVDLFGADKYLTLIPGADYKIQIEYWVTTNDPNPGAHPLNSTVTKNVILSDANFNLEQGKAYEYHMNLGMTTVKFDAVVTNWNTPAVEEEVDLPNNSLEIANIHVSTSFTNITDDFMGEYTTAQEPTVASNKYYWNTTTEKLMVETSGVWAEAATAGDYFTGTNLSMYTLASSAWTKSDAPKYVKSSGNYYMLVGNAYTSVTYSTAYGTLRDLLAANPGDGLYEVDGTVYYYKQH